MKFYGSSVVAIAAVVGFTTQAQAQESQQPEMLPEAVAEGEHIDEAYEIGTGNDSGVSTINRQEIEARTPGSGDVNQLLKALPTVQFDRNEGVADRRTIQDLRPAEISISGGRIYDNLITLDGIAANSRLDTTNDNPFHFAEPSGASPQTLWLDSELIGSVTLRDSNISAEYSQFTGGALDIQTRQARRQLGFSANVNYTEDSLVNYIVSDGTRAYYEDRGDPLPEAPEFRKWRYGASVDMPLSDKGAVLVAVNRSTAKVLYFRSERYNLEPGFRSSVSENLLVSANYDVAPELNLSGQISYSPYESEAAHQNGINNLIASKGGGLATKLKLASTGDLRWDITANYVHNDTGRMAPPANYSIPSSSTNGAVCSNRNCTIGGFGKIDQTQDTYSLKARIAANVGPGELRGGIDYKRIDVLRKRPETNYAYSRAITGDNIVCVNGESLQCANGQYAVAQYNEYRAYTADIGIDSLGIWTEYDATFGPVDIRAGLRYDYESFLGNHNIAPRFAATWNVAPGWTLTGGANRYYGRSMVAYAIREQYPDNFIYRRTGTLANGDLLVSDNDWNLYKTSIPKSYSQSDLDTPYSDELTAAVSAPIFGGIARIKGIYRWGKDEFSSSQRQQEPYVLENGNSTTRRFHLMTNDGRSKYRGVSLEWVRVFNNHTIALSTNFSKTSTNNKDYFDTTFELDEEDELVLYNGEIIELVELLNQNQRLEFASPFFINASWTARWFDGRLTTNVNMRYRDGFEQIKDTGENERIDGVRYDVYDIVKYSDRINIDLNAQLNLLQDAPGKLTADVRISNLLDKIPSKDSVSISQPYQYGRSFWFGLKFKY